MNIQQIKRDVGEEIQLQYPQFLLYEVKSIFVNHDGSSMVTMIMKDNVFPKPAERTKAIFLQPKDEMNYTLAGTVKL